MKRAYSGAARAAKKTRAEAGPARAAAAVPRPLRRPLGTFSGDRVHTFERSLMMHHNITDAPLQNNAVSFCLNALPNYTEMTNLFDVYRIRKVKVTFICDRMTALVPTAAANLQIVPNLWYHHDYDDATAIGGETEWGQIEGAQWKALDRTVYTTVYPRVAQAVYAGAFTSYGNTKCWVDCNSPAVQFYGLKWAYDAYAAAGAGATVIAHINIRFNFVVDCKGIR